MCVLSNENPAYDLLISDWSSDVGTSDLPKLRLGAARPRSCQGGRRRGWSPLRRASHDAGEQSDAAVPQGLNAGTDGVGRSALYLAHAAASLSLDCKTQRDSGER